MVFLSKRCQKMIKDQIFKIGFPLNLFNRITQFHDNYNVNIIDDVVFFDRLLQIKT